MPIKVFSGCWCAWSRAHGRPASWDGKNRDCALTHSLSVRRAQIRQLAPVFPRSTSSHSLTSISFWFYTHGGSMLTGKAFFLLFVWFWRFLTTTKKKRRSESGEGLDCNQKDTTICSWTLMWNKIERFSKTCNKFGRVTRAKIVDFEFCRQWEPGKSREQTP